MEAPLYKSERAVADSKEDVHWLPEMKRLGQWPSTESVMDVGSRQALKALPLSGGRSQRPVQRRHRH